jgi:hypothetical protein
MFRKVLLSLSLFILSGCSFEPSNNEVEAAVRESLSQDYKILFGNDIAGMMVNIAGVESIKIDSVDKIGCQSNGKNSYLCEVSVEFTINTKQGGFAQFFGLSGSQRSIERYRLVKTSRGWTAISDN